jgi:D-alanyl-D-alanine dipeptidase
MKRVAKVATPAAIAVLRQATALFPKRKKTIRRWIVAFVQRIRKSNPNSDHNTGLAVDLTHDPKNGIDCAVIFEKLERR